MEGFTTTQGVVGSSLSVLPKLPASWPTSTTAGAGTLHPRGECGGHSSSCQSSRRVPGQRPHRHPGRGERVVVHACLLGDGIRVLIIPGPQNLTDLGPGPTDSSHALRGHGKRGHEPSRDRQQRRWTHHRETDGPVPVRDLSARWSRAPGSGSTWS